MRWAGWKVAAGLAVCLAVLAAGGCDPAPTPGDPELGPDFTVGGGDYRNAERSGGLKLYLHPAITRSGYLNLTVVVRNEGPMPERVLPIDPDWYQPELLLRNGAVVPAYTLRLGCRAAIPEKEMPLIWPNNSLRASYRIDPSGEGYALDDVIKCRIRGGQRQSSWAAVARL
ncbi:MAG: hypothetical protein ACK47B_02730 [Armatimonadota bacterium]